MTHVPSGCPLTIYELRVVELLLEGLQIKQAAARLGVSASTVRSHLQNAYRKLDVVDRTQAILECVKRGWIEWEGLTSAPSRRITLLFERLERAVRERAEADLTAPQRAYLAALEKYLTEPIDIEKARAKKERALLALLEEAGVDIDRPGRHIQQRRAA